MWFEEKGNLEVKKNKLFFAGLSCEKLALKFGTPLYAYNAEKIKKNFQTIKNSFRKFSAKQIRIHYAMKANSNLTILKLLRKQGAWLDCVSLFEVKAALKAGFPIKKILFTGVSVSNEDLKELAKLGIRINIDSFSELKRLHLLNPKNKEISIRVNPAIGLGAHSKTMTGGKHSKFGIPIKNALKAVKYANENGFKVISLHEHVGSGWQENKMKVFFKTADSLLETAKKTENITGISLEFIDFGGGPGISFKKTDKPFNWLVYAEQLCNKVKKSGLKAVIAIEPGRSLVGNAGILLAKVNEVEEKGVPVIAVNAGFTDFVRPVMYNAYHEIVNCSKVKGRQKKFLIAGYLCQAGDVFNENRFKLRKLTMPKENNVIAILSAGAYGYAHASTYNLKPRPAEVMISKKKAKLITRRDSFNDLMRLQEI